MKIEFQNAKATPVKHKNRISECQNTPVKHENRMPE
jgi:hypothetical protein